MTRFIDVHSLVRLVDDTGVPQFLGALADALRDDFLRWREFDKIGARWPAIRPSA